MAWRKETKRFLSRSEVSDIFEVSANTVTRWAKEGKLPYVVTPGGQHRYPREAIERLVEMLHKPQGAEKQIV